MWKIVSARFAQKRSSLLCITGDQFLKTEKQEIFQQENEIIQSFHILQRGLIVHLVFFKQLHMYLSLSRAVNILRPSSLRDIILFVFCSCGGCGC
jgi:hypothetical protein